MVKCSAKKCIFNKEGKCTCEKIIRNYEEKAMALLFKCENFKVELANSEDK